MTQIKEKRNNILVWSFIKSFNFWKGTGKMRWWYCPLDIWTGVLLHRSDGILSHRCNMRIDEKYSSVTERATTNSFGIFSSRGTYTWNGLVIRIAIQIRTKPENKYISLGNKFGIVPICAQLSPTQIFYGKRSAWIFVKRAAVFCIWT